MREIKFRVWNKTLGRFDPAGLPIIHNSEKGIFGVDNSYVEHFVVQQYTGLKDKNGVEIYEGDIIEHNSRSLKKPIRQTIEFEYLEGGDDADMDSYGYHINPYWNNDFEVVGNIFEGVV